MSDSFNDTEIESVILPCEEEHWIEIELVDESGAPVAGVKYLVVAPDNEEFRGVLNGNGMARVHIKAAGMCKVSFVELDQAFWQECLF